MNGLAHMLLTGPGDRTECFKKNLGSDYIEASAFLRLF